MHTAQAQTGAPVSVCTTAACHPAVPRYTPRPPRADRPHIVKPGGAVAIPQISWQVACEHRDQRRGTSRKYPPPCCTSSVPVSRTPPLTDPAPPLPELRAARPMPPANPRVGAHARLQLPAWRHQRRPYLAPPTKTLGQPSTTLHARLHGAPMSVLAHRGQYSGAYIIDAPPLMSALAPSAQVPELEGGPRRVAYPPRTLPPRRPPKHLVCAG
ncbi:hypothetical protein B0H15DRAFT_958716 [Mycena belliarum]|uniref:Uncharacterized protein n=1 Tax=Mycena belliarum TaxID=1033014 RepID=A0AAD6TKI7_9AGAR|nr:hypothetical protein B0H15DRAFT_958716 [Mycena belliae]